VERGLVGWRTNTAKRTVGLYELESGGPGKDVNEYVRGSKLGLFGFVLPEGEGASIFISLYEKGACVHFEFSRIGFVLHKRGEFVEGSRRM
jgi:hypothetical protein